jgi:hypothetical protein
MYFPTIKILFYITLFLYISACSSQEKTVNETTKDTVIIAQKTDKQVDTISESAKIQEEIAKEYPLNGLTFQQVEDTLKKLKNVDSIQLKGGFFLNIGKLNSVKYAFIWSDRGIHHYIYKNNKWIKMYHFPNSGNFYKIEETDINKDRYKDLIVSTTIGISANLLPHIFLYDSQKKLFIYKKYLSLTNIEVNTKDSLITSSWFGSVCSSQSKSLYKWQADSVLLIEDYEIEPNCGENEGFCEIRHYLNDNGKISESTKKYKTEKAWEVFDKAKFKISKGLKK